MHSCFKSGLWGAARAGLLFATFLLFSVVGQREALADPLLQEPQPVVIYFFWGDGCPHCAAAKPFLAELAQRYPGVEVRAYEVWYSEENRALFLRMATAHGFEPSAVPTIFIGDQYWVGFAEQLAGPIEAAVAACAANGCPDAGVGVIPGVAPAGLTTQPTPDTMPDTVETVVDVSPEPAVVMQADSLLAAPTPTISQSGIGAITIPLLGEVNLAAQSLTLSTGLIAFVDGFNPCSLWVLSVLLALTLRSGSRRKVLLVGLVFLTVTSLVYALFIAGLFTMFTVISFVGWIQVVVALVALFFAAVNIKDYFWYKEGVSFTIAEEKKPGIYQGMRRILAAGDSTWGVIAATVVLAAGVSLVEFSCTAGFPVLWTNLLVSQEATALTFGALLLLYMLIYQLDELVIFAAAIFTLKSSRLEEKQGRLLKLIGGMLMLTLAVVMLINPAWMNQIASSLWVFAAAFGGAALILLTHRVILPRWGIHVGSELRPAKGRKKELRRHPRAH
jgi:thiol-disulfide isomerase/thioredoxin